MWTPISILVSLACIVVVANGWGTVDEITYNGQSEWDKKTALTPQVLTLKGKFKCGDEAKVKTTRATVIDKKTGIHLGAFWDVNENSGDLDIEIKGPSVNDIDAELHVITECGEKKKKECRRDFVVDASKLGKETIDLKGPKDGETEICKGKDKDDKVYYKFQDIGSQIYIKAKFTCNGKPSNTDQTSATLQTKHVTDVKYDVISKIYSSKHGQSLVKDDGSFYLYSSESMGLKDVLERGVLYIRTTCSKPDAEQPDSDADKADDDDSTRPVQLKFVILEQKLIQLKLKKQKDKIQALTYHTATGSHDQLFDIAVFDLGTVELLKEKARGAPAAGYLETLASWWQAKPEETENGFPDYQQRWTETH